MTSFCRSKEVINTSLISFLLITFLHQLPCTCVRSCKCGRGSKDSEKRAIMSKKQPVGSGAHTCTRKRHLACTVLIVVVRFTFVSVLAGINESGNEHFHIDPFVEAPVGWFVCAFVQQQQLEFLEKRKRVVPKVVRCVVKPGGVHLNLYALMYVTRRYVSV